MGHIFHSLYLPSGSTGEHPRRRDFAGFVCWDLGYTSKNTPVFWYILLYIFWKQIIFPNWKLYTALRCCPFAPLIHLQIHPSSSHRDQASEEQLAAARAQPPVVSGGGGGGGSPATPPVVTIASIPDTQVNDQPLEAQDPSVPTEEAVEKTEESKMWYHIRYLFLLFNSHWPNQLTSPLPTLAFQEGPEGTERPLPTPSRGTLGLGDGVKGSGRAQNHPKIKTRQEIHIYTGIYVPNSAWLWLFMVYTIVWLSCFRLPPTLKELLRDAAKAQLRRMCTLKKKRLDLNVDDWVITEWKKRPKDETAQLLINANFDKARYIMIGHFFR